MSKKECPCCENFTLDTLGNFEICPVCFWEDDPLQAEDILMTIGANKLSLESSRKYYSLYGCSDVDFVRMVRKPYAEEINPNKREIL